MKINLEDFSNFCSRKDTPNSGKSASYVKSIKILFEYLHISSDNFSDDDFKKILQIEKAIHNKNSKNYAELFDFVTMRGQSSYLVKNFFSAAINQFKDFYENLPNGVNSYNKNEESFMQTDLSNEIYYGVPGTGKTYKIQQDYINNEEKKENTITTTFHQSFSYEEFVEGIKAKVNPQTNQIEYKVEPGIFYNSCLKAAKLAGFSSLEDMIESADRAEKTQAAIRENKIVYFCIDEINRGNIASIFGELISLIEPSKRIGADSKTELVVTLPYSGKKFGVPANLKIIGTMNTADRSIQLLDSALRRRFRFIECKPEYNGYNSKAAEILKAMNNRIRALLGKDYQIGHAYFMNVSEKNQDMEIFEILRDKIIPLLEEYFYGETEKIRIILNENTTFNAKNQFYVQDSEAMNSVLDYDNSVQIYKLNENLDSLTDVQAGEFINHIE